MKLTKIIQSSFAAGMNNTNPLPVPLTELMLATVSYC